MLSCGLVRGLSPCCGRLLLRIERIGGIGGEIRDGGLLASGYDLCLGSGGDLGSERLCSSGGGRGMGLMTGQLRLVLSSWMSMRS